MWPRSRCGLGLDMTSVSLWPRFQYVLGLDVASVLIWPRSGCSLVLDVTSISMWPRSRCDLVVNMASVLMWPRSRSGLGLDVASASILPRSRCGPCLFPCPEAVSGQGRQVKESKQGCLTERRNGGLQRGRALGKIHNPANTVISDGDIVLSKRCPPQLG